VSRPIGVLVRMLWTATLLAGAVGVARQRAQARAVTSGALSADGPAGDRRPERPPGPLGAWLAAWQPAAPRTLAGQLAATVWSAPLTLTGVVVALASGAHLRWDPTRRCLVARGVRGPSRAALRLVGAGANTIGQVVLCRTPDPSVELLDHEALHVRQAERLGPLLVPTYLWLNAIHGYRDNPLERAARLGARLRAGLRDPGPPPRL
jgi:hypothetical protein